MVGIFRGSYEMITGQLLHAAGVRRKALLVGDEPQRTHLRETLGSSRGGIGSFPQLPLCRTGIDRA